MKFLIFFIFIPLVSSELHTFFTTYTEIRGLTTAGIPAFSAVNSLDEQQIDYYDSNIMKLIPRQDWMEGFASKEQWKEYTEIREKLQQVYKNNIVQIKRFNQTHGVHTYQRMYGCGWDDETGHSHGFDEYAYNGENFISLDLKQLRYVTSVPQAKPTVMKWNNNKEQLKILQQYFEHDCVFWLKELLHFSKAAFKKTDPPNVSLLQKNADSHVECHVTGFFFRNTTILWRKYGQDMNSSSKLVETGKTLPNEDGTFQRTLSLYVLPNVWKKSQYTCVVEHQSLTETIQKILTVNEIRSNQSTSDASYNINPALLVIIAIVIVVLIGLGKHRKKLKDCCKRMFTYVKNKCSKPENSLISPPSEETSSPLKDSESYATSHDLHTFTDAQYPFPEPSPSPVERASQHPNPSIKIKETSKDV